MDADIKLPSLKSQKLIHGQILGEGEDIISNLPDAVIHHILSFIPTKDVIKTCILSKRWQFLWTSVSNIDLISNNCKKDGPISSHRFLDFVDKVLTCYSSSIEKLCLYYFELTDISRVSKWISSAIRRRVQELCLSSHVRSSFLPHCLLNCKSLTTLKLEMDCILQVPNSICLPNLRILCLSFVIFFDDNSFENLFSGCPVLQELSLMECVWKNIKRVAIFVPTLHTLAIDYYMYGNDPEDFLDCEIKIYAERATYFDCSGNLTINIMLCNFSLLDDASISILPLNLRQQEVGVRGFNLFEGVRNVRSLSIYHETLEPLSIYPLHDWLPVFENLTYLELDHMEFDYCASKALKIFLEFSPNLTSLVFGANMNLEFNVEDWISAQVPQCLKSRLKNFSVKYFCGNELEMRLLGFFLKNARILEKMKIYCGENLNKDEVMNHLYGFPKESANCVIHVE
ncbi:hypothetical protein LguiA_018276 [Lonicera macranthoides]